MSGVKSYGVKGVWCKRHLVHKVFGVIVVFVRKMSGGKAVWCKSCIAVKGVWCQGCLVQKVFGVKDVWCKDVWCNRFPV